MDLITVDFETFYSKEYSLSKMTTEEYIRSPLFQTIGVGVRVNNGPTEWASGTHEQLKEYLHTFDWDNAMLLCHNTMFDGAILSWIFDVHPKVLLDTLCMARALHGVEVGGSLKALVERYDLGAKGTEVVNAMGKRREDFSEEELSRYGDYCINDVDITLKLFEVLGKDFPQKELKLIDMTLRMFTEPVLELDRPLLVGHLEGIKNVKEALLLGAGVEKKDLMSNPKFAKLLQEHGVEPPMKISLRTGKETYAFAKTDPGFKALLEHELIAVQVLAGARVGLKGTLEETRTQRFLDIEARGLMPVPIRYYAAHTGRWGGDDKINLQNLPSRGPHERVLKRAIRAPVGYAIIDADSAQIEARVLAWLAGQNDLVQAFAEGRDVYREMASKVYHVDIEDVTKEQRFVGKTTILGCGYGMGAVRFQEQLKTFGVSVELEECRRIVQVYRATYPKITALWKQAGEVIKALATGQHTKVGKPGVLEVVPYHCGVRLPSGLVLRYDDLKYEKGDDGWEYTYYTRRGRTRIYGGKAVENWTQAIARCIIGEQALMVQKEFRPVLTVHDSLAVVVKTEEIEAAKVYVEECMGWLPEWAEGLPVEGEAFVAVRYGDCYEGSEELLVA